jgi:hypothetical protein
VDRLTVVDRLWDYFKFVATVDMAGIVGILTVYTFVGLLRSQAVGVVAFLAVSLFASLWALHRLADPQFTPFNPASIKDCGWLVWGCYWAAWIGLVAGIVGFITTAWCGPDGSGLCAPVTWR